MWDNQVHKHCRYITTTSIYSIQVTWMQLAKPTFRRFICIMYIIYSWYIIRICIICMEKLVFSARARLSNVCWSFSPTYICAQYILIYFTAGTHTPYTPELPYALSMNNFHFHLRENTAFSPSAQAIRNSHIKGHQVEFISAYKTHVQKGIVSHLKCQVNDVSSL